MVLEMARCQCCRDHRLRQVETRSDFDPGHQDWPPPEHQLPVGCVVKTPRGGRHHHFAAIPGADSSCSRFANHVDYRGEGGYILIPPSVVNGTAYEYILGSLAEALETTAPAWLEKVVLNAPKRTSSVNGHLIPEGQRNNALASIAGRARREGAPEDELFEQLKAVNSERCSPPLPLKEVQAIARSIANYGPAADADLTAIKIEPGKIHETVDAAERALLAVNRSMIYQRGHELVRVSRTAEWTKRHGIERPPESLSIHPVEEALLVEEFTRVAQWWQWDGRSKASKRSDCPRTIARTYLARRGRWHVPRLTGIIEAPTILPDGAILAKPGYDPETGLFFDPGQTVFDSIPEAPTKQDAIAALAELQSLLSGFPWVEDSDRSAALAAILTALVRPSLPSAPAFSFGATAPGTGKTLLANVVAMMATGRVAPCMPQGKDENEDQKRILSLLLEGGPVACVDNIDRPIRGAALCIALTQDTFKDRVLGASKMATVSTRTTWLLTGNNLVFEADVTSRVVPCDLDPQCREARGAHIQRGSLRVRFRRTGGAW